MNIDINRHTGKQLLLALALTLPVVLLSQAAPAPAQELTPFGMIIAAA